MHFRPEGTTFNLLLLVVVAASTSAALIVVAVVLVLVKRRQRFLRKQGLLKDAQGDEEVAQEEYKVSSSHRHDSRLGACVE